MKLQALPTPLHPFVIPTIPAATLKLMGYRVSLMEMERQSKKTNHFNFKILRKHYRKQSYCIAKILEEMYSLKTCESLTSFTSL